MSTSLNTGYLVNSSDSIVTVEIIIGSMGQHGRTHVELTDGIFTHDFDGSLPETNLATNFQLRDKHLIISSVIQDLSDQSNLTELILRLRGGVVFREYHLSNIAEEDKKAIEYNIIIRFITI